MHFHPLFLQDIADMSVLQRKADRIERMRDDPYYIVDDRPKRPHAPTSSSAHDIDSIPVVKLELSLPSMPVAQSVPPIRASDVFVDRTGHMPSRGSTPTPAASSPVPELSADAPANPEPIKVVRAKKKKSTGPSKKLAAAES